MNKGETISQFRIQENKELQEAVDASNSAMADAVAQQNAMVANLSNSNTNEGAGQPENLPIITPNFSQWNEADPFFVSKFDQFRSTKPDMHCTNKLK